MAPKSTPWFRLYSEVLTDRKILRIRSVTDLPKCTVIGAWTTLLIMANDSPERGRLLVAVDSPILLDEILTEWELGDEVGQKLMEALVSLNLIHLEERTYAITQWDARQFTSDQDGAERVKRYRERQRVEECNNDVTLQKQRCNNDVTPPESESYTDIDKEGQPIAPVSEPIKQPEVKKSNPPKNPPPPAVEVWRGVANRYPDKAVWGTIARTVSDTPENLELWSNVVRAWVGCGWNKLNVTGQLDFFKRGEIPGTKQKQSGQQHGPNGSDPAPRPAQLTDTQRRRLAELQAEEANRGSYDTS